MSGGVVLYTLLYFLLSACHEEVLWCCSSLLNAGVYFILYNLLYVGVVLYTIYSALRGVVLYSLYSAHAGVVLERGCTCILHASTPAEASVIM